MIYIVARKTDDKVIELEDVFEKSMLTEKELKILSFEYDKKKKSVAVSYILYIFLSVLLIHRIYIGSTPYSMFLLAYILFCIIGLFAGMILTFFSDVLLDYFHYMDMIGGGVLFLLPFAWLLLDVFRIPTMVNEVNSKVEKSILTAIIMSRG
jgi:hypothetical protein